MIRHVLQNLKDAIQAIQHSDNKSETHQQTFLLLILKIAISGHLRFDFAGAAQKALTTYSAYFMKQSKIFTKNQESLNFLCKVRRKLRVWENVLSVHKVHSGFLVHLKPITSSASKIIVVSGLLDMYRCENTQKA